MSAVDIRPVRTGRDRRTFLTFPWRIYRDNPLRFKMSIIDNVWMIDTIRPYHVERGADDGSEGHDLVSR